MTDVAVAVNRLHEEIGNHIRQTLELAIQAGKLLAEQKPVIGHGGWERWVEANCRFDVRTARNYMRVYRDRERIKSETVSGLTDAYRLLTTSTRKPKTETVSDLPKPSRPSSTPRLPSNPATGDSNLDTGNGNGVTGDPVAGNGYLEGVVSRDSQVSPRELESHTSSRPSSLMAVLAKCLELIPASTPYDVPGDDIPEVRRRLRTLRLRCQRLERALDEPAMVSDETRDLRRRLKEACESKTTPDQWSWGRENKAIAELVTKAQSREEPPEPFLRELLGTFMRLKRTDKFYRNKPLLPSQLLTWYATIVETMDGEAAGGLEAETLAYIRERFGGEG